MKISSYFTEGELDIALTLFYDFLSDEKILEEASVTYDAGDRLIKLLEKIEFYKLEMQYKPEPKDQISDC